MKRRDLIKRLEGLGCVLVRHGEITIGTQTKRRNSRNLCLATMK